MNFLQRNAHWIALVAILIAIGGYSYPHASIVQQGQEQKTKGVTNYDEVDATAIKVGGTNGTRLGPVIMGTCSLIGATSGIVASTSIALDCAVTGVVTGDYVMAQFATTSPSATGMGWLVTRASASTTSGFITLSVTNGTGLTGNMPASIGSSTTYFVTHPVSSVPGL